MGDTEPGWLAGWAGHKQYLAKSDTTVYTRDTMLCAGREDRCKHSPHPPHPPSTSRMSRVSEPHPHCKWSGYGCGGGEGREVGVGRRGRWEWGGRWVWGGEEREVGGGGWGKLYSRAALMTKVSISLHHLAMHDFIATQSQYKDDYSSRNVVNVLLSCATLQYLIVGSTHTLLLLPLFRKWSG